MSFNDVVAWLIILFRTLGMIFAFMFVIRYRKRPWRTWPEGQHLMYFSSLVGLFLLYATVNSIVAYFDPTLPPLHSDGDYVGRDFIALILYTWVAWSMWERNALLRKADRERKAQNAKLPSANTHN